MSVIKRLKNKIFGPVNNEVNLYQYDKYKNYIDASKKSGVNDIYLFLSFDCDTDLDATAAIEVDKFLTKNGIKATYAVPGSQLEKAADVYQKLANSGSEFMNHGGQPHAEWNGEKWIGRTFYNEMFVEDVIADIRNGDSIVTKVIGKKPIGFRAPHFGCFQSPEQIEIMHSTAESLGYKYCSTTLPSYGLINGPAHFTHGLYEFSCFGSIRNPETILDSWTYLSDRVNYSLDDNYYDLLSETVNTMLKKNMPGILTWYGDPAHVLDQSPFIKAIELIAKKNIKSVTGEQLVSLM